MAANAEYGVDKEMVNAVVRSVEKMEGAVSILELLEDKADAERISPAELAAVRSIIESCASELDEAWKTI